ncbi:WecB/TagA/CpsF family glycosyltransferase [Chloroflexus sp.]|uniref:WecB/TagA/CpsF family glycosyltransferase n=1 Tax=Chloroflexus sp. TaxID=1904827 RepID=UPI003D144600
MIVSRITLLGVVVDLFTIDRLNQCITTAIKHQERWIIAHHNLHSIYLYHRDQTMRQFYEQAHVIHIDGMSLVYWGRILGYKLNREHRVTYVDWIHPLMAMAAAEGWRIFYLGSKPGVAALAAERLRQQYPALQITTRDGYFQADDNTAVLAEIANFRPHVLMVGMGMPRQEHWILTNLDHLSANAILTSGACFDYIAGVIPTPPRWMGRTGLEWLYRLYSEPSRLARRYLLEPWALLPLMARDLWQMTRRERNFDTQ